MAEQGFGIDVGGSGIKGASVDLTTGALTSEIITIPTPQPATPAAVARTAADLVAQAGWTGPVGVTLPLVVTAGIARTAANVDSSWIGSDTHAVFGAALGGSAVTVLNDADAAGLAEDKFGAGSDVDGVVVLLTFGTGIGSAILFHGQLLPNTEFGHMQVDGMEAEHRAAASVRTKQQLSYKDWAAEVSRVLIAIENLLWPDLFVAGGGISADADQWLHLLTNRTPVVPAKLRNTAGIVGAAMAAETGIRP
ncbi:polyphosphate--glucose phosphotransferase [Antrihabitans sp. YC2-6]|uniref:polyphosphate--glucose phosphotransferase n=1 Tax=Antrihabitans sp. YC2-6 TaxID=2799498 RepID=UPI0018F4F031|nr:ROK family protein [Antrihabitans sp. YC2-6]MBJ8345065.1 ROK family protein [Antrihabitans sp. YC2-6]